MKKKSVFIGVLIFTIILIVQNVSATNINSSDDFNDGIINLTYWGNVSSGNENQAKAVWESGGVLSLTTNSGDPAHVERIYFKRNLSVIDQFVMYNKQTNLTAGDSLNNYINQPRIMSCQSSVIAQADAGDDPTNCTKLLDVNGGLASLFNDTELTVRFDENNFSVYNTTSGGNILINTSNINQTWRTIGFFMGGGSGNAIDNWTISYFHYNYTAPPSFNLNSSNIVNIGFNDTVRHTINVSDNDGLHSAIGCSNVSGSDSCIVVRLSGNSQVVTFNFTSGLKYSGSVSLNQTYFNWTANNTLNLNSTPQKVGYTITGCKLLDTPNIRHEIEVDYSQLTSGVCLNITANNITLEGGGRTIGTLGGAAKRYGLYSIGRTNLTIKNLNIEGRTTDYLLYLSGVENSTFINVTSSGSLGYDSIYMSNVNTNNFINSSFTSSGSGGSTAFIFTGNNNRFINTIIGHSHSSGTGLSYSSGKYNLFENGTIYGGAYSSGGIAYSFGGPIDATTNFTGTGLNSSRDLSISSSVFNYRENSSFNVWIRTSIFEASRRIRRIITSWTEARQVWNETNISHALTTLNYSIQTERNSQSFIVYNKSKGTISKSYILMSSATGLLPSFNVSLNENTEIEVIAEASVVPSFTNVQNNASSAKMHDNVSFGTNISDIHGLSFMRVANNLSNAFINESLISLSGEFGYLNTSILNNRSKNTNVCFMVWANDTLNNGNTTTSCFTTANNIPVIISNDGSQNRPSINNTPITTQGANVSWNFADLDNDTITNFHTSWFVNGNRIAKAENSRYLTSDNFTTDDSIIAGVNISDGFSSSLTVNSSNVTVGDGTAPLILDNFTSPTSVERDLTIDLFVNVTDANSDINSVTFWVTNPNGAASSLAAALNSGNNAAGQTTRWKATFTTSVVGAHQTNVTVVDGSLNTARSVQGFLNFTVTAPASPAPAPSTGGGTPATQKTNLSYSILLESLSGGASLSVFVSESEERTVSFKVVNTGSKRSVIKFTCTGAACAGATFGKSEAAVEPTIPLVNTLTFTAQRLPGNVTFGSDDILIVATGDRGSSAQFKITLNYAPGWLRAISDATTNFFTVAHAGKVPYPNFVTFLLLEAILYFAIRLSLGRNIQTPRGAIAFIGGTLVMFILAIAITGVLCSTAALTCGM